MAIAARPGRHWGGSAAGVRSALHDRLERHVDVDEAVVVRLHHVREA
jgi:hypothetical protein